MKYFSEVIITNYDDVLSFAEYLIKIPVFCKLSSEEKLKIIYSYPFRYEIVNKNF